MIQKIKTIKLNFPTFVKETPLEYNQKLSSKFGANIYLKREDLQSVRSYKIRGAFARMSMILENEKNKGVICASAGNHAQGVALCCKELKIKGLIFMPITTPCQKIEMVKNFGQEWIEIELIGDTFDASNSFAKQKVNETGATYIPPFDDEWVIAGQGTIALEILKQINKIDYILVPVGGGGLASGVCSVINNLSKETQIIGIEPSGAPSMTEALKQGQPITLSYLDTFVDGAAVKRVGDKNFEICKLNLTKMMLVDEGKVCSTILEMYNQFGIVLEPAGALTIAALNQLNKEEIKNKNIVLVISGGNNDITRMQEIRERAMLYEGLKHYFLIRFPQRPGALKEFVSNIVGPTDDITYFQFSKKNNRESGPAVVGIELKNVEDFISLEINLKSYNYDYEYINQNSLLFQQLIN